MTFRSKNKVEEEGYKTLLLSPVDSTIANADHLDDRSDALTGQQVVEDDLAVHSIIKIEFCQMTGVEMDGEAFVGCLYRHRSILVHCRPFYCQPAREGY